MKQEFYIISDLIENNSRVLDVGCGDGTLMEYLKNNKEIDMSRPSYEIYLNRPEEHPEHHHILDVCMAVK